MIPHLAAAAVLGVLAGSRLGFAIGARSNGAGLKMLMAAVLITVAVIYFVQWRAMTDAELSRLEHQIGRVLRVGVVLSAIALAAGLVCRFAGIRRARSQLLRIGLVILLMAIPVARIVASFVDAIRRRDRCSPWRPLSCSSSWR